MSRRMDGGPAFPRPMSEDRTNGDLHDGNDMIPDQQGMSLRDYFAAKAMDAVMGHSALMAACNEVSVRESRPTREIVAENSYRYADAMLVARERDTTISLPAGHFAVSDGVMLLHLEPAEEGGFTVTCPAIKGLVTEGDTLAECFEMARDAAATIRSAVEGGDS